jgi:lipid A 4'-phosphatase
MAGAFQNRLTDQIRPSRKAPRATAEYGLNHMPHNRISSRRSAVALGVTAACAAVTAVNPNLDLAAAKLFYAEYGGFVGNRYAVLGWIRQVFITVFVVCCVVALTGLVITRYHMRTWLGLVFTQWLFIGICMGMGPGIVSNLAFKDHWGRARPSQITEFGGTKLFTPAFIPSNQCNRNCSFVSGEASSVFVVFFAAAFVFRRKAMALVLCGITAGVIAGLVRMSQGAHFITDVVFAGVFMALTAAVVNYMFEAVAAAGKTGGPLVASGHLA